MKQLSLLAICLLVNITIKGQVSTPNNNTNFSLQYVGWVGTTATIKPLDLKNGFNNQPINFFTNSSGTNGVANVTQRMTILGTTGFVSIGLGFTNPTHQLDVFGGDINVGDGTPIPQQGYMIGNNYVLRHKGVISNIFVGVGAGNATTGTSNTFVGGRAGATLGFVGINANGYIF